MHPLRIAIALTAVLFVSSVRAADYTVTPLQQDFVFRFPLHIWEILSPTPQNPVSHFTDTYADIDPGSTLIIQYSSIRPVPIQFASLSPNDEDNKFRAHDFTMAVLPADTEGQAILPLTTSNRWNRKMQGITITAYGLQDSMPRIHAIGVGDTESVSSIGVGLSQLMMSELLKFDSTNYLEGYRVLNVPLAMIFGITLVALCALALILKRQRLIAVICLAFMLLYQVRFLTDIVPATAADISAWNKQRTVPSFSHLMAVGELLNEEAKVFPGQMRVAMCGNMITPLKYFIHPIPIDGQEWLNEATHGVMLGGWMKEGDTYHCNEHARQGRLLHKFPEGFAVVRFSDES